MNNEDKYLASAFRDVDSSHVEKMMICLDSMQSMPCFLAYKKRTIELLGIDSNSKCLEVACGLGDDLARLGRYCSEANGVDISARLIEEARRRWTSDNLHFHICNAEKLEFPDAYFNSVRIDRSLQHVADCEAVVAEMVRVTTTG